MLEPSNGSLFHRTDTGTPYIYVQGAWRTIDASTLPIVFAEIAQRGLQEAYIIALCQELRFSTDWVTGDPTRFNLREWLNDFSTVENLWLLLTAPLDAHMRAFTHVTRKCG